ncbi:Rha family transcriptional regulator [Ligilactobacillus agilis]|uniref:Rha family transcriptional regulator n=1 Tax=Ligilactobacillus agilis TaxID=1601 RepID=UPI003D805F84
MEDLVIMHDQQVVTTSLKVAEIFEKEHRDVMKSIRNLTAQNFAVRKMFGEDSYLNSRNQKQPMYYMNRDGFTLLAMGFTGSKVMEFKLKYIEAFNRMEQALKEQQATPFKLPQTYSEALYELAEKAKQIEALEPRAKKYDRYLSSKGLITTTEVAKEYGMSGRELNEFLHEKGVIYKRGDKWFVYQKYANDALAGYEIYIPRDDKEVWRTLKWTTKGVQFIRDLLDAEDIKPVLERPQQLTIQEQPDYHGRYFTASQIAYYLGLSEEWIIKIGEIANKLHLKPMFAECNQYCRKTLDANGFPRWEYTKLGAGIIEAAINEELSKNNVR